VRKCIYVTFLSKKFQGQRISDEFECTREVIVAGVLSETECDERDWAEQVHINVQRQDESGTQIPCSIKAHNF
jgi:hypothetical protein